MLSVVLERFYDRLREEERRSFLELPRELSLIDCRVLSAVLWDVVGGDVLSYGDGPDHFVLLFDSEQIHPGCNQVVSPTAAGRLITREPELEDIRRSRRGRLLSRKFEAFLREPSDVRHVVTRAPTEVGGSYARPVPDVLIEIDLPGTTRMAEIVQVGDEVLFGWKSGRIVARLSVQHVVGGSFENYSGRTLREYCRGTATYSRSAFWESLAQKGSGFFSLVKTTNIRYIDDSGSRSSRHAGWSYCENVLDLINAVSRRASGARGIDEDDRGGGDDESQTGMDMAMSPRIAMGMITGMCNTALPSLTDAVRKYEKSLRRLTSKFPPEWSLVDRTLAFLVPILIQEIASYYRGEGPPLTQIFRLETLERLDNDWAAELPARLKDRTWIRNWRKEASPLTRNAT